MVQNRNWAQSGKVLAGLLARVMAKKGALAGVAGKGALIGNLDGQNRQSPIASDFGSRTQIAALFAVLLYRNV